MMTEITTSTVEVPEGSARVEDVIPSPPSPADEPAALEAVQREAIARVVRQARDAGIALSGPDGLLKVLTVRVVEAALG